LYDVNSKSYSNKSHKTKAWEEIAEKLLLTVDVVNKKNTSLQTQYSRFIKPPPSSSGCATKTSYQKWLVEKLNSLTQHIKKRLQFSACSEHPMHLNSLVEILKTFRTRRLTKN